MTDKLKAALDKLDPANDNHWTQDGLPRIDTVRMLAGNPALTREDLTEKHGDFNRTVSQERSNKATGKAGGTDASTPTGGTPGNGGTAGDPQTQPAANPKIDANPVPPATDPAAGLNETGLSDAGIDAAATSGKLEAPVGGTANLDGAALNEEVAGRVKADGTREVPLHAGVDAEGNLAGMVMAPNEMVTSAPPRTLPAAADQSANGRPNSLQPVHNLSADTGTVEELEAELKGAREDLSEAQQTLAKAQSDLRDAQNFVGDLEGQVEALKNNGSTLNPITAYLEQQRRNLKDRGELRKAVQESGLRIGELQKALRSPLDTKLANRPRPTRR